MKLKDCFLIYMLPILGCKCQVEKTTHPTVYNSIEISKDNNAYIKEFLPESPYLKVAENNYYIDEAWVEVLHFTKTFRDVLGKRQCLVVHFKNEQYYKVDLHSYIQENGAGATRIWRSLDDKEYNQDTLAVQYRDNLDSPKKNKVFLFFKKR